MNEFAVVMLIADLIVGTAFVISGVILTFSVPEKGWLCVLLGLLLLFNVKAIVNLSWDD